MLSSTIRGSSSDGCEVTSSALLPVVIHPSDAPIVDPLDGSLCRRGGYRREGWRVVGERVLTCVFVRLYGVGTMALVSGMAKRVTPKRDLRPPCRYPRPPIAITGNPP